MTTSRSFVLFLSTTMFMPSTEAFAPQVPTSTASKVTSSYSSITGRVVPQPTMVQQQQQQQYWHMPSGSSTALQANLVERFFKVAQSNALNVVRNLEKPEKILNQAMNDMQNDLVKIRQSYAEISAQQKRVAKEQEQVASRAGDWYRRAQLAMRSNNDGLAKEALTRRQLLLERVDALQKQLDTTNVAADKLYQGMRTLEDKIREAKQRKDEFIARAKAAESTQQINDMLSGMTGKTSMDAFRRMEEKVEALEAAAEASAEMVQLSTTYLPSSDKKNEEYLLESEFLMLESNAAVDEEFKRLKSNLLTAAGSSSTRSIPITEKRERAKVYASSIEKEFAALRKREIPERDPDEF